MTKEHEGNLGYLTGAGARLSVQKYRCGVDGYQKYSVLFDLDHGGLAINELCLLVGEECDVLPIAVFDTDEPSMQWAFRVDSIADTERVVDSIARNHKAHFGTQIYTKDALGKEFEESWSFLHEKGIALLADFSTPLSGDNNFYFKLERREPCEKLIGLWRLASSDSNSTELRVNGGSNTFSYTCHFKDRESAANFVISMAKNYNKFFDEILVSTSAHESKEYLSSVGIDAVVGHCRGVPMTFQEAVNSLGGAAEIIQSKHEMTGNAQEETKRIPARYRTAEAYMKDNPPPMGWTKTDNFRLQPAESRVKPSSQTKVKPIPVMPPLAMMDHTSKYKPWLG